MEFICKTCSKSFKFQSSLKRHGRIHNAFSVKCDCGLSFSRRDSLRRHQFMSQTCGALENATPPNASTQIVPAPYRPAQIQDDVESSDSSGDEPVVKNDKTLDDSGDDEKQIGRAHV